MKRGHIELSKAAVTAVAIVTLHVKQGVIYSNVLIARVVDQISGNYNYKMGVAKVKKLGESKYKTEFRSMSFAPRNIVLGLVDCRAGFLGSRSVGYINFTLTPIISDPNYFTSRNAKLFLNDKPACK